MGVPPEPALSDCLPLFSEDHMYLKINKFLLSHEYLNMSKVPGFYQFFYSSDLEVRLLKSPRARGDSSVGP